MRLLALAASLATFASTALAQGTLTGLVLTDPDERPIAGAEIIFTNLARAARSDSAGRFRIVGIPVGAQAVLVRMAGYQPWIGSVTFEQNRTVEADFLLKAVATALPVVEVSAGANRYATKLTEFDERRKGGHGRFITADEIEKHADRQLSDLLIARIPGIRLVGYAEDRAVSTTHNGRVECLVQVVLDGNIIYNGNQGQPPFKVNSLSTADVIGIEFYTTGSTPARYTMTGGGSRGAPGAKGGTFGGAACGTLILWTK
jgi:hypothetical protein